MDGAGPEHVRSDEGSGFSLAGLPALVAAVPPVAEVALEAGASIGGARIVRLVGTGGMGRVYEALQEMPRRTVAVKVIRTGFPTQAAARRFAYEAEILARLSHPGIARVHAAGIESLGGRAVPYFVMEYVERPRAITAFAREEGLSTAERVRVFREACLAVAHGHLKGVVHRDLKPGNILVDRFGQPKVIDFGVARSTEGDIALTTMHTSAGELLGTLQYMAPEQLDGDADALDFRCDVYALGLVLYELLAGRPPYDVARLSVWEIARIVRESEPPSLAMVDRRLRGDLQTIVSKCLEKERQLRYSSAVELADDLGRHLAGEPILARPVGLAEGLRRLARRHRGAAFTAVVVLVSLVASLGGITGFAWRAETQRAVAERERVRADREASLARRHAYRAELRGLQSAVESGRRRIALSAMASSDDLVGAAAPPEWKWLASDADESLVTVALGRPVDGVRFEDGQHLVCDLLPGAAETTGPELPSSALGLMRPIVLTRGVWRTRIAFEVTSDLRLLEASTGPSSGARVEPDDAVARDGSASVGQGGITLAHEGPCRAVHWHDGTVRIDGGRAGESATLDGFRGRIATTGGSASPLAAFLADGTRFALLGVDGALHLWDTANGRRLATGLPDRRIAQFVGDSRRRRVVAIAPSAAAGVLELHLIDIVAGTSPVRLEVPLEKPPYERRIAFAPDGSVLAVAGGDHAVHVFATDTGRGVACLRGQNAQILAMQFREDGGELATAGENGHVHLWDTTTWMERREFVSTDGPVLSLSYSPDGRRLATGSQSGRLRLWDAGGRPLAVLGQNASCHACFGHDGRLIAIADEHGGVVVWDVASVVGVGRFEAADPVLGLAFSPRADTLAIVQDDGPLLWRFRSAEPPLRLQGPSGGTAAVAFDRAGKRLVAISRSGRMTAWRTDPPTPEWNWNEPDARGGFLPACGFGLADERIVAGGSAVLSAVDGTRLVGIDSQGRITALALSADGKTLACGTLIGGVNVAEVATGRQRLRLFGHSGEVRSIAFAPDTPRLVTGGSDGSARVWDTRSGEACGILGGHGGPIDRVHFGRGGRILTVCADGHVRIWDADDLVELARLPCDPAYPAAVAIHPEGDCILAGWHDPLGRCLPRLWGHSNAAILEARQAFRAPAAAVAPDGEALPATPETPPGRPGPGD
jgi:WD40 repeat protein